VNGLKCELEIAHPDNRVRACIGAATIGALDYRYDAACLSVQMIYVMPSCRQRGVAAAMLTFLQRQYPAATIVSVCPACNLSAWLTV